MKSIKIGFFTALLFLSLSCTKDEYSSDEKSVNLTVAQTLEGSFSGNGKYMPGNIKLGTFTTCQEPPWSSYQKFGNTNAIISVINDSTVNIKLTGSIYNNSFNKKLYSQEKR